MPQIGPSIPQELIDKITKLAERNNRTFNEMTRELIRHSLETWGKESQFERGRDEGSLKFVLTTDQLEEVKKLIDSEVKRKIAELSDEDKDALRSHLKESKQ